jgi:phosphoribosylformylglycinamidine (FGAM) synthase PurS component
MKAQELHPLTFNFEITTGNRLHSEGVIALCESLKTNTTLTDLSLDSEPLVNTIRNTSFFSNDEHGEMTVNRIRDPASPAISKALRHNTTLTKVDLRG